MDLRDFDAWLRSLLEIEALSRVDDSLNGIQVGRSEGPIDCVAFAVDASMETMRRAAEAGARALMVHHGLFWGSAARITGSMRERVKFLLDHDLALAACHLPLDKHPELGNNAVLARMLGLADRKPFGLYHGVALGFSGTLEPALSLDEAIGRILPDGSRPLSVLPFGPKTIRTAAVVSGGAAMEAFQAVEAGLDLYVTGENSHSIYHAALEAGLNVVAAGHYATEVWGVKSLAERLAADFGVRTFFVDVPTGL